MNQLTQKLCSGIQNALKILMVTVKKLIKRCFNRKEFFTVMIIPHASVKNVRSIKFPKWIVSSFILINAAMFAVVCLFGFSYSSLSENLKSKKTEYQVLQTIKESDDKQLDEYKANEEQIKEKIQVLKDLENRLQDIIDTKGEKAQSSTALPRLASRGVGGDIMPHPLLGSTGTEIEFENIEDMYSTVDGLVKDVDNKVTELNEAITKAENKIKASRAIPSVLPTTGSITSIFGYRKNPFGIGYEFHPGLDIANSRGTAIMASADGVVIEAGRDSGGYGLLVKINHGNGYVSLYGHNSKIVVKVGETVKRGQVISYMGSTGRSTGNHCHFEVRLNGKAINPYSIKS